MAKGARAPALDEKKKLEILAILSVGCSRRTAAEYVGCDPRTINRTAERDAEFAEQLRRAENQQELACLKQLQQAARKEQYWRAAAWILERRLPERYGRHAPQLLTLDQVKEILKQLAEIVVEDVPVARYRKNVIKRLEKMFARLEAGMPADNEEPQP